MGIGGVHEEEIDEKNILQATYQAMRQSVGQLSLTPEILLVDGNNADIKHYEQESIIDGEDAIILSVGSMVNNAVKVVKLLEDNTNINAGVINCRFIKPIDEKLLNL